MADSVDEPSVDVFLSYSHGAFLGNSNPRLKQWAQRFAEDLREELLTGGALPDLSVFLDESDRADESVDRTADLTAQLEDRAGRAALLAVLMTDQYLRSRWCSQERQWWLARNTPDSFEVGVRRFICRVMPTREDWPAEFLDRSGTQPVGYQFYDPDATPGGARPYCWGGTTTGENEYMNELLKLTGDMAQRLRDVRAIVEERRKEHEQRARLGAGSNEVVFVHAREEATDAFEHVRQQLQARQFVVMPSRPVPVQLNGRISPEFQAQMAASDALLLLAAGPGEGGAAPGDALDADMVVVGKTSRHLALGDGRSFMPCAVLDTVGEPLSEPARLRNARNLGLAWIDATVDGWPQRVRSWLGDEGLAEGKPA